MSEFLGARISLVSKSDIRYVGTLHEINSDESTVSLENVRSFGTEGRRGRAEEEIGPSDQIYEYIVFRGSDVKDLRIEEPPAVKENKPPAMPDDPAIVGLRARPRPQDQNQNPPPPAVAPIQQHPYPPPFFGGPPPPGAWGRGGPMAGPEFGNMPYPPPPGWFPPGQGFPPNGPAGPGLWNNAPYPPRPGGPSAPDAPRGIVEAPSAPAQDNKPMPIGPGSEKVKPTAGAQGSSTEPKSLPQATRQPANAPPPAAESKQSTEVSNGHSHTNDATTAAPSGPRQGRVKPVMPLQGSAARPPQPPSGEVKIAQATKTAASTGPSNIRDATQAAREAVALAMSQLGSNGVSGVSGAGGISNAGGVSNVGGVDNLTNKVNEMRMQAGRGGGGTAHRGGRGRGGRTARVEVPDADFDFAQANAKFKKEDLVKEASAGSPQTETPNGSIADAIVATAAAATASETGAYNRSRSFFDNISSEAKDRADNNGQKPGGREWRGEEQRKNMETFGQGSVDGGYRNYRGRGRGRGGRGYGRGGRGGPRPQYQSAAASQ